MSTVFSRDTKTAKEEERRRLNAEHMRAYRKQYPEKDRAARIRAAVNLLRAAGYTVTPTNNDDLERRG